jgi:hypothetical protein
VPKAARKPQDIHRDRPASYLGVSDGTNRESTFQILEKGEKACLLSASLSMLVRLEPEILVPEMTED